MPKLRPRQSGFKIAFKPAWDYNTQSLENNIIRPTINLFSDPHAQLSKEDLKFSHNNLSHTERLGLITIHSDTVELTELGRELFRNNISFQHVLQQYLAVYSVFNEQSGKYLFPYRALGYVLDNSPIIRKIDFLYGIYPLADTEIDTLNEAIDVVKQLQIEYPDSSIDKDALSYAEKDSILVELNEKYNTDYVFNDLWTSQTTVTNRLNYFANHLSVFDIIARENQTLKAFRLSTLMEEG